MDTWHLLLNRPERLSGHLLPEQIRGAGGSRSSSLEPLSPSEGIEEAVLDPEI